VSAPVIQASPGSGLQADDAGMRGATGFGSATRQAYGHEIARLMVYLQAMQESGNRRQFLVSGGRAPYNAGFYFRAMETRWVASPGMGTRIMWHEDGRQPGETAALSDPLCGRHFESSGPLAGRGILR